MISKQANTDETPTRVGLNDYNTPSFKKQLAWLALVILVLTLI